MKQIFKELIHRDYCSYWEREGVNKRLNVYKRFSVIAEVFLFMLNVVVAVVLTKLLLNSLVGLIDRTSEFYEMGSVDEIKDFLLDVWVFVIFPAWSVSCILPEVLRYGVTLPSKKVLSKMVSLFPFVVIVSFLVVSEAITNEMEYLRFISWLIIFVISKFLANIFINRVEEMYAFAHGTKGLLRARVNGSARATINTKSQEGEE